MVHILDALTRLENRYDYMSITGGSSASDMDSASNLSSVTPCAKSAVMKSDKDKTGESKSGARQPYQHQVADSLQAVANMSSATPELPDALTNKSMADQSPLLKLPGELRNRIYRLALLEPQPIGLSPTNFVEPSLLVACHQIRREAATISYGENTFRVPIPNYDSTMCKLWTAKFRKLRKIFKVNVHTVLSRGAAFEEPDWENAIEWIQRRHSGAVRYHLHKPSSAPRHFTPDMMVLGGMFLIAIEMKGKPWSKVKKVMEEQHRILVAINPKWEKRKDREVDG